MGACIDTPTTCEVTTTLGKTGLQCTHLFIQAMWQPYF